VAGGTIEGGRLTRVRAEDLEVYLAAASEESPPRPVLDRLADLWPDLAPRLDKILETRANQRKGRLATNLETRCAEETAAMEAVLAELRRSIQARLDDTDHWVQPSLFEIERQQLRADEQALRDRLAAIPAQLEDETAALRRRYADPQARWFPAAVTFLVPAAIAYGGMA